MIVPVPVLRRYAPSPAAQVRPVPCPADRQAASLLTRRRHIPVITDVIMGAECVKTVDVVTG
jgi:hypothetical protein